MCGECFDAESTVESQEQVVVTLVLDGAGGQI